jgi:hypothetical protein
MSLNLCVHFFLFVGLTVLTGMCRTLMAMSVSNFIRKSRPLKRGTSAQTLDQADFGRKHEVARVAVIPDSSRLIAVGPLLESPMVYHQANPGQKSDSTRVL